MWLTVSQSNVNYVHYDSALSDSKQTAGFFNGWLEGGKHFLQKKTLPAVEQWRAGNKKGEEEEDTLEGRHPVWVL